MKKTGLLVILFFLVLFSVIWGKAYSYQNFDGNYVYEQYGEGKTLAAKNFSNDEEILFIVDYSGSMAERLGFEPKIYLAVNAIRNIIASSGTDKKIGLRVFGVTKDQLHQIDNRDLTWKNANELCRATSLLLPVQKNNSENISDIISFLNPRGATPILYSLKQAVENDFSSGNDLKHIILITDGYENCGGDPCLYIKNLMRTRNDIKIDVIGITVDGNGYSGLNCLATASKGKYYAVNDPDDFKIKIKQAFESTPQPVKNESYIQTTYPPEPIKSKIDYQNYVYEFNY